MPTVQVWIKNEDWDKYYQLSSSKQWGEFIHSALNPEVPTVHLGVDFSNMPKPIKTMSDLKTKLDREKLTGWHGPNFKDKKLNG